MALSEQEKQMMLEAKESGKTKEEALSMLASNRAKIEVPQDNDNRTLSQKFTSAIGLGGAVDVFGSQIARITAPRGEGDYSGYIKNPSLAQSAGAAAQVATIPLAGAITGGTSILGQMAAGGALGYAYDVGADLSEGKTDASAFAPGIETAAGLAVPPVLKGAGVAMKGLGTAFSKTPVSGVTQRVGEVARTLPRAVQRGQEFIQEGAEKAAFKKTAGKTAANAIDQGLTTDTVKFVQDFDNPTRKAALEMIDLAESGRGAALPQTVPGRIAGQQLNLVDKQRKAIGQQIGEFSDSLPTQQQSILPSLRNLRAVLDQNGIKPFADGIRFENKAITPKQQGIIQQMYELATQSENLSPKQIHQIDQLFSKLQREARFEGVDDVFIKVPTAEGTKDVNIYKFFRDVFGQQLDQIAEQAGRADIKDLNRQYRTLRNLEDNVESTIIKQSRLEGVNIDPSESASVALRRLFSNAQSRAEYQDIYNQLDTMSRQLGFEGPRADTLMDFYLTDMKPLYPESVPKASFEGGIRGAISGVVDKITEIGSPSNVDKQKALRALLGSETSYVPAGSADELFAKKSLSQRTKEALKDTRGALNPQRQLKDNPFESLDYDTLSPQGEEVLRKFLKHVDGTEPMTDFDYEVLLEDVRTLAGRAGINSELGEKALANQLADRYSKQVSGSFNQSATTKTTDLLAEARKYKSADAFIRARKEAGIVDEWGTQNQFLQKTGGNQLKDVELVIKGEKPAAMMSISESDVTKFKNAAEKEGLSIDFLKPLETEGVEMIVAKDDKALKQLSDALTTPLKKGEQYNRRLGLALGYRDLGEANIKTRTQLEDIWKQANEKK